MVSPFKHYFCHSLFFSVKINEDASVDWLLLQLHIKRCIQSSANSHAYGQNIKKQSFFAEQVTAKSINLSKMVKTEAKDKVLTVIPERRWVLVIVPLAQAQQTFGNFWDTQNNPGSRYVTQSASISLIEGLSRTKSRVV